MLKILVLSLILVGCGSDEKSSKRHVDEPLKKHVDLFYETFQLAPTCSAYLDHDVRFGAKLWGLSVKGNYIKINIATYPNMSQLSREALVFHELAHCERSLRHDNRIDEYDNAVSLMSPTIDFEAYHSNRDYYIFELKRKMR